MSIPDSVYFPLSYRYFIYLLFLFNLSDLYDCKRAPSKDDSTGLQKEPVPVAIPFISLHQYSEEERSISLTTFSQMEELIHRHMIWSILQSLHPSCVDSLERHDNVLHLRHLIFPLQRHHRKVLLLD